MQHLYRRPVMSKHLPAPIVRRPVAPRGMLAGLGELGDTEAGAAAVPNLMWNIQHHIVAKASPLAAGALKPTAGLAHYIGTAANYVRRGKAGQLPPDEQRAWNDWSQTSWGSDSPYHVYWKFANAIERWADQLAAAAYNAQLDGSLTDPQASQCVYTLVDTSQTGTTWYGSSVVSSKLTEAQWGAVFDRTFDMIAKGILGGTLSFTYLDVLCRATLAETVKRRFPVWYPPPGNLPASDPRAVAFRTALRQLGWQPIVADWGRWTLQAWAAESQRAESVDAFLSGTLATLNFLSGKVLYDQVAAKMEEYLKARADAVTALRDFAELENGPLADQVPARDIQAMAELKKQFNEVDNKLYGVVKPAGLWPEGTSAGMSGLGAVQAIVAGAVIIGLAGMVVWAIGLMTSVARNAAAQTRATADNILATVDEVKASCLRTYNASAKTPADEQAYRDCLASTEELVKHIPDPPDVSDPLGLKWVALVAAVGIGGLIAYKQFGKK